MNFLQYRTPQELQEKTGLTVEQAIAIIDKELDELKKTRE